MARPVLPLALALAGIGTLVTVLAIDSARSSYRHASTMEHVLTDYAALGAEGVSSRLQAGLATRFTQVLNIVSAPPARRDSLERALSPYAAALARMVVWTGRLRNDSVVNLVQRDTAFVRSNNIADSLRATRSRLSEGAYIGSVVIGNQLVVFSPNSPATGVSGAFNEGAPLFAVRIDSLSALLNRLLAADPVLPHALTRGETLGDRIGARIRVDQQTIARRGIDSSAFHAHSDMGAMFGGMQVEVFLAESLAPTLIIGGLPHSRLPFLLGALLLTAALVTVMILQLRQHYRLSRLREDFVASTSHELRTPLAQIRLFAETLRLERVRSEDERTRALVVIEREARRLEHLVDNMLHASRMERGTLQLFPRQVSVSALTSEVVSDFMPLAEKTGALLTMRSESSAHALVDPDSWRQIVLNLLDNAVRYSGRGALVDISVTAKHNVVQLQVSDNGPGISIRDRDRVWERFWRGEAGRNSAVSGAGIGLATVRELVELQGGSCHVADNGSGATIMVQLPMSAESSA